MAKKIIIILISICVFNCEEIIEVEDISQETVTILAPMDNADLSNLTINFSWESISFADTYHLQIALPNFEAPEQIIVDTILASPSFQKTLEINTYQWRIKAKNFAYETIYTTQNLNIED